MNGRSVAWLRSTRNCSGVSCLRHSLSVLVTSRSSLCRRKRPPRLRRPFVEVVTNPSPRMSDARLCDSVVIAQDPLHVARPPASRSGRGESVRRVAYGPSMPHFPELSAVLLNCSLVHDASKSHTRRLLARVGGIMRAEGVAVDMIHMLDHRVGFGMVKDTTELGDDVDDWPGIHDRIMAADILVIGTPIWLGMKSSVATLAIERLYAYSSDTNDRGQYLYYGKAGGCVVTGNDATSVRAFGRHRAQFSTEHQQNARAAAIWHRESQCFAVAQLSAARDRKHIRRDCGRQHDFGSRATGSSTRLVAHRAATAECAAHSEGACSQQRKHRRDAEEFAARHGFGGFLFVIVGRFHR